MELTIPLLMSLLCICDIRNANATPLPYEEYSYLEMEGASCPCPESLSNIIKKSQRCRLRLERKTRSSILSEEEYQRELELVSGKCSIGDICLSDLNANQMLENCLSEEQGHRGRHRDILTTQGKWGLTITYSISSIYPVSEKQVIQSAFSMYTAATCLTFNEVNSNGNLYIKSGSGCSSHIGKQMSINQIITLETKTYCLNPGSTQHEIAHALGLYHEHSRPDRDSYLTVDLSNLRPGVGANNFYKYSYAVSLLTGAYDYSSVMQYSAAAGSISPDKNVLDPTHPEFEATMGQRAGAAFYDIKSVNARYCKDTCASSGLSCQNDGYPNPNGCTQCHCHILFTGTTCTSLKAHSDTIRCKQLQGVTLTAGTPYDIQIAPYTSDDLLCIWKVQAPPGYRVVVNKTPGSTFHIGSSVVCIAHWLELRDGLSPNTLAPRYCGTTPPSGLKSTETIMYVIFEVHKLSSGTYSGFSLRFTTEALPKCQVPTFTIANADNDIGSTKEWIIGAKITYTCQGGYYVAEGQDTLTRTCILKAGLAEWSTETTLCKLVECPRPTVQYSDGGTPAGATFTAGQTITFTCNAGKETVDGATSFVTTCAESSSHTNTWNNLKDCQYAQSTCLRSTLTNYLPNSNNGLPNKNSYTVGETVTFTCNSGFKSSSSATNTFTVTCTSQNTNPAAWTGGSTCVAIPCSAPPGSLVSNANLKTSVSGVTFVVGSMAEYQCNDGFSPAGGATYVTATCTSTSSFTGQWTTSGQCIAVCLRSTLTTYLPNSNNGLPNKSTYTVGETVTFTCNSGFKSSSSSTNTFTVMCSSQGNAAAWTGASTCVDIDECTPTSPCPGGTKCFNTVGSYDCPCSGAGATGNGQLLQLSLIATNDYTATYGSKSTTEKATFETSASSALKVKYNSASPNSVTACYICNVKQGSTIIDHTVKFVTGKSDSEKGIFANTAKDAFVASPNLVVAGTTLQLAQPLALSVPTLHTITTQCSYYDAINKCQNGGVCKVTGGAPVCSCPSFKTGEFCQDSDPNIPYYIAGGVVGGVILIVIMGVVIYYCCRKSPSSAAGENQGNTNQQLARYKQNVRNQNAYQLQQQPQPYTANAQIGYVPQQQEQRQRQAYQGNVQDDFQQIPPPPYPGNADRRYPPRYAGPMQVNRDSQPRPMDAYPQRLNTADYYNYYRGPPPYPQPAGLQHDRRPTDYPYFR